MEGLRVYYVVYLFISASQLFGAWRNLLILIAAQRWASVAMCITILILCMNGIDFVYIVQVLRGVHTPAATTVAANMFWFGVRNLFSVWYWVKVKHFFLLTKERCQYE